MPAYTLGDVMSFVTTDIGRRSDIAASTASRIVNEAYFEVTAQTNPQSLESVRVSSTTTGVGSIELPTDFLEPISASLFWLASGSTATSLHSSYMTLEIISIAEFDSKNPQPSGVPRQIAFFNTQSEFYPSPNSAYSFRLRYVAGVEDLVSLTSVPSLSTPWRLAWKMKAEEKMYNFIQDEVGAFNAQGRYFAYVSQLKSDLARRQSMLQRQHVDPSWGIGGRRKIGTRRGSTGRVND